MSNVRISDLPEANTLDGTELVEVTQDGFSRQTEITDIANLSDPGISEIVSIDADRTLLLTDKGKTILLTGTTQRLWTVPSDTGVGAVEFPIGTLIGYESESTASIALAITAPDTLTNSEDGTTPTAIGPKGGAVLHKTAAATWKMTGDQLT